MDYKKIDRLRQLDEMHYRGFITQEEEAERKALLTEIQEQAHRDRHRIAHRISAKTFFITGFLQIVLVHGYHFIALLN